MERFLESPGEKDFRVLENPRIWSFQVPKSPGKTHMDVCTNPERLLKSTALLGFHVDVQGEVYLSVICDLFVLCYRPRWRTRHAR